METQVNVLTVRLAKVKNPFSVVFFLLARWSLRAQVLSSQKTLTCFSVSMAVRCFFMGRFTGCRTLIIMEIEGVLILLLMATKIEGEL